MGRSGGDVQADVSDPASVQAAFDEVRERFGPVLILVNNAGVTADGLAIRMPTDRRRLEMASRSGASSSTM